MYGHAIHDWAVVYLAIALVSAMVATVFADTFADADPPPGARRTGLILLTAALWPLAVVGVIQLAVVDTAARRARTAPVGGAAGA